MNRALVLLALAGALLLGGCGSESSLPSPTGKGKIRAINAIPGSPPVRFLIEEFGLGDVQYKQGSSWRDYDDFSYNFNFEASFPGELVLRRVATVTHQVEADRTHIFVLTGDIEAPTVTLWNDDVRTWDGSETTFEVRFAHTMQSLGPIDVHFNPVGEVPAAGQQAATLDFGEIAPAALFEAGDYVITITAAGDLATVHFTSDVETFVSQSEHVISGFDGDANDTAPYTVTSITGTGVRRIADVNYPPTLRVIQGSLALPAADVYDDEALTSLFVGNLGFGDTTANLPVSGEELIYYFTPTGSTGAILFQRSVGARSPGTRTQMFVVGEADSYAASVFAPDRASYPSAVRLFLTNASSNAGSIDVYVLDRGETITEDTLARAFRIQTGLTTQSLSFPAGSYDLYVTPGGEKTVLAGPFEIDAVLGDVIELVALDTAQPEELEIRDITLP